MYIVTRADLTPGQQATQATHAAFSFSVENPEPVSQWHDASNNLVLLAVPDEEALRDLGTALLERGHTCVPFYEPDLDDALTAIAVAPSDEASRMLSHLPLALREAAMV
jgi:hypothetical protein